MARQGLAVEHDAIELKLTAAERKLLRMPVVLLPEGFEERLNATPSRKPVTLAEEELEELVESLAGHFNAAQDSGDTGLASKLDRLCDKVERLLDEHESARPIFFGGDPFAEATGEFDPDAPILDMRNLADSENELLPTTPVARIELTKAQRDVVVGMNTIPDDLRQMLKIESAKSEAFQLNLRQAMVLTLAAAEAMYIGESPADLAHLSEIAEQLAGQISDESESDRDDSVSAAKTPSQLDTYYQLKITLDRSKPPIWRRVRVADCTLGELHTVIQMAMGWENYHLHSFRVGEEEYGNTDMDEFGEMLDEETVLLSDIVGSRVKKIRYWYDFGDDWWHTIQIESTHERKPNEPLAVCTKGKRACPPEDCGGIWGYYSMLETIEDPESENRESILEWLGGPIDPEHLDLEAINAQLARFVEA